MQKNKRGDSKVESNDSPEIPDIRETDIPGLPSGLTSVVILTVTYVLLITNIDLLSCVDPKMFVTIRLACHT